MGFLISSPPSNIVYKEPVRAASTVAGGNIPLSGGASLVIDGETLVNLDRVLLKDQSSNIQNGIYQVTGIGVAYALTRASDADSNEKLRRNSLVPVSKGAGSQADQIFQLTSNTIDVGVLPLIFASIDSVALAAIIVEEAARIAADNLKAPIANPTFTGTVGGITAAMVGAPAGSGNSTGTNTGDNSANSLYTADPMTTIGDIVTRNGSNVTARLGIGSTEKVLATDGSAVYWAIEGVKTGYPAGTVVLGRTKPSGLASALNNTICGVGAGNGITSGVGNVVLGLQAGGVNNQGFGTGITTGSYNIILGAYSGGTLNVSSETITTQNYCIAVGFGALTMGHTTLAIGYNSVAGNTNSIAIGNSAVAGNSNYSGYGSNISIGTSSSSYDGHLSIAIGASAISRATESIAIGYNARTYGNYSVIAGAGSGGANLSGANNTVVGADSFNGASLTTANANCIFGKGSGKALTTGNKLFIGGNGAAPSATVVTDSVVIGNAAASSWVNGHSMVVIGANISCNASAYNGVVIGAGASIGYQQSVAIGTGAFADQAATALGWDSWAAFNSVAIGGRTRHKGNYGVMVGTGAGYVATGDLNVGVGFNALANSTTNAGCVALGHKAGFRTTTQSNELFIDNQDRGSYSNQQTQSLLYGVFHATASSQTLAINADLKMLAYTESVVASGVVGATATISILSGTVQTATLTASTACTFTMPTATAGKSFTLYLKQAATTGLGTATFTGVKWATAGAPAITATAGQMDILSFVADGTNWYGSYQQGYTP